MIVQVLYAQQEQLLIREKREILHDKQIELPIREITDDSVYHRVQEARLSERSGGLEYVEQFTDPKFHDQWYLVSFIVVNISNYYCYKDVLD